MGQQTSPDSVKKINVVIDRNLGQLVVDLFNDVRMQQLARHRAA